MQLSKKDFDYVYVFFDNEYSGYLRWEIYNEYKANRDKHYHEYGMSEYMKQYNENLRNMQNYIFNKNKKKTEDKPKVVKEKNDYEKFIDENFARERDTLCRYFNELFIRWYMDDVVEGDDLIAYYCQNKKPNEKIVIVTGDGDISQLLQENVCVYNIKLKKYITNKNYPEYFGIPSENILIKKVFCGDVSDNISNISGLSEAGLLKLMPEIEKRPITIEEVKNRAQEMINERIENKKKPLKVHENIINGVSNKEYDGDFYEINKKIIDLKHPLLTNEAKEEMDSMRYAPQDPEDRTFGNLYKMINEDNIEELMSETKFSSFFNIFKRLQDKELKLYQNSLN
jgi:5'-3' exonuclease